MNPSNQRGPNIFPELLDILLCSKNIEKQILEYS